MKLVTDTGLLSSRKTISDPIHTHSDSDLNPPEQKIKAQHLPPFKNSKSILGRKLLSFEHPPRKLLSHAFMTSLKFKKPDSLVETLKKSESVPFTETSTEENPTNLSQNRTTLLKTTSPALSPSTSSPALENTTPLETEGDSIKSRTDSTTDISEEDIDRRTNDLQHKQTQNQAKTLQTTKPHSINKRQDKDYLHTTQTHRTPTLDSSSLRSSTKELNHTTQASTSKSSNWSAPPHHKNSSSICDHNECPTHAACHVREHRKSSSEGPRAANVSEKVSEIPSLSRLSASVREDVGYVCICPDKTEVPVHGRCFRNVGKNFGGKEASFSEIITSDVLIYYIYI